MVASQLAALLFELPAPTGEAPQNYSADAGQEIGLEVASYGYVLGTAVDSSHTYLLENALVKVRGTLLRHSLRTHAQPFFAQQAEAVHCWADHNMQWPCAA